MTYKNSWELTENVGERRDEMIQGGVAIFKALIVVKIIFAIDIIIWIRLWLMQHASYNAWVQCARPKYVRTWWNLVLRHLWRRIIHITRKKDGSLKLRKFVDDLSTLRERETHNYILGEYKIWKYIGIIPYVQCYKITVYSSVFRQVYYDFRRDKTSFVSLYINIHILYITIRNER